MQSLLTDVGWPIVVLAAVMLIAAAPTVLAWWRFELRLACRALTLPPRTPEGRPSL